MSSLTWAEALWLARRGSDDDRPRRWFAAVTAGMTAVLLCTAAGLVADGFEDVPSRIQVVADGGTRGGAALAVLLLLIPGAYLAGQSWRVASVARRRRLRQLAEAGASVGDLRRVVVADTAMPAVVGAVVGVVLLGLVASIAAAAQVLPNVVLGAWWPAPWAVLATTALAGLVAAASAQRDDRVRRRARPTGVDRLLSRLAGRVGNPAVLLAVRGFARWPGETIRPAVIFALAAAIAASSIWLRRQFRATVGTWAQDEEWDLFYGQAFDLVAASTALGLVLCALALLVELTDSVRRRRREDAAAVAAGVPVRTLRAALVIRTVVPAALAVATGTAVGGALSVYLTGRIVYDPLSGLDREASPYVLALPWVPWAGAAAAIVGLAAVAACVASLALRRTTEPQHLRIPA
ncbi:MAG: FtsX-like permease family protein [Dermatophilaceae bacterium]